MPEELTGWQKTSKRLLHASSPGDWASDNRPGVESPATPPRLVLSAAPKEGSCGGKNLYWSAALCYSWRSRP